tara:strand:- start:1959 stop:2375 length:417 start_codon:yes stop_codon:yes gene_type:complete
MSIKKDKVFSAQDLSLQTSLPITTVSKILTKLTKSKIISSVRGVAGGYKLLIDAKDISVGNIIDVIDGKVALTVCIEESNHTCGLAAMCPSHSNWQIINNAVSNALNSVSIEEMSKPIQNFRNSKIGTINSKFNHLEN